MQEFRWWVALIAARALVGLLVLATWLYGSRRVMPTTRAARRLEHRAAARVEASLRQRPAAG